MGAGVIVRPRSFKKGVGLSGSPAWTTPHTVCLTIVYLRIVLRIVEGALGSQMDINTRNPCRVDSRLCWLLCAAR